MVPSNWQLQEQPDLAISQQLQKQLNLNPVTAGFLVQNGLDSVKKAEAFLHPDFASIHDPAEFYQMDVAVERIQEGIFTGEKILVYGDYDVDGITSTAIMVETLLSLGADVTPYIPNRFTDGYGPNLATYKRLIQETGATLIITVDNGVSGNEAINWAMDAGVDVVVTDHHALPAELPNAYAIIHPLHPEGNYPFAGLSGAGVAFKVAQAILADGQPAESLVDLPTEFLDLVAMGAVADVMPLTDENRAFVTWGLKEIETKPRPGLEALLKSAKHSSGQPVLAETIGFKIAPRLNAIGRLADGQLGLDLLLTKDPEAAKAMAKQVEKLNDERRDLVESVLAEAKVQALDSTLADSNVLLVAGENWHQGILGIVAARLVDLVHKPVVVLSLVDGIYKGSGRSYAGFDLHAFLAQFSEHYVTFGGHAGALGVGIAADELATVMELVKEGAHDLTFESQPLKINLVVQPQMLTPGFYQQLSQLEPFGEGNPQPILALEDVALQGVQTMGADQQHLKLNFAGGRGQVEALAFNQPDLVKQAQGQQSATMAGKVGINTFAGKTRLQLMLEDVAFNAVQPKSAVGQAVASATNKLEQAAQAIQPRSGMSLAAVIRQTTNADFARLYKYLYSHQDLDVISHLESVLSELSMQEKQFKLMIQVFLDLHFVKMNAGTILCLPSTSKKPLEDSVTYQRYFAG
ncbi:single-stranded DNA-specific exonuclease [Fructobacillus pseudoficulneus]|uniref:Single-stranded-DNA-specific exonuclease RecJ n=1 Tax=Fructobacillus pseudoficulneus TaxID=220714 RepID=A0A3F3GTB5_9LACO|nr:single-stranded-DNA-specific exonuclease RecJ [Fructobacillus pseudoficulneus]GAP02724.1 single-stranded DNA-specific exonuclease [Fructobacillus pseudoficulneus]SEH39411.1 exonuclease RecJ [Fructobacillus pseudoficulneus]